MCPLRLFTSILLLSSSIAVAQGDPTSPPSPVDLIRRTITNQDTYWAKQQKYACSYQIVTRDRYDTGISTHAVEQTDQIIILHGNETKIINTKTGKEVEGRKVKSISASQLFSTWRDPLFESVVEHSKFTAENLEREHTGRPLVVIEYEGDPDYHPTTDVDRIAQSLSGQIVIDLTENAFVSITGKTDFDVVDGKNFLVVGRHPGGLRLGIPLLEYESSFYNTAYLPTVWSQANFRAVRNNRDALANWSKTLSRTFMQRVSCQVFSTSMRILPGGSVVVPNEPAKP